MFCSSLRYEYIIFLYCKCQAARWPSRPCLHPNFLKHTKILVIRIHLRLGRYRVINICMNFQDLLPKMGVWGQNRGSSGAMFTSNELNFTFGGFYVLANFGENRSRNVTESVHRQTDRKDANQFYNLSHAICYSYGADKNVCINEVFMLHLAQK